MEKGKTYVAMILDKSGSMMAVRKSSLESFNDQIKVLREESKKNSQETILSIVLFDHEIVVKEKGAEIDLIKEISETEYIPSGMTALYDAIGQTIARFEKSYELKENDAVLFVIVTDGFENSSIEFSGVQGQKTIKDKIKELTDSKQWTFTFVGTELALDQADSFGIHNTLRFDTTPQGMSSLTDHQATAYSMYFNSRSVGETSVDNLYGGIEQSQEEGEDDL